MYHSYWVETVTVLFDTMAKLRKELGIQFEFINIGGGLGIPYKPTKQEKVDIGRIVQKLSSIFKEKQAEHSMTDAEMPRLFMENGTSIHSRTYRYNNCHCAYIHNVN